MRNRDVQRTFVILRQLEGRRESGYARAETREGRVRLNLVVQGFAQDAQPQAFAADSDGLIHLGALRLDARGQGGLLAELNPSDFRRVQLLLVAQTDGEGVVVPLAGTVGRSGWVDWENIRALLTEALLPQRKEAAEETKVQPEAEPAEPAQTEQPEAVQETQPEAETAEPAQTEQPEAVQETQPEAETAEPAQTEQPEAVQETQPEVQPERPVQTQAKPEPEPEAVQIIPEERAENREKSAAEADVYDQPAQEDPSGAALRELLTPLPEEKVLEMPEKLRDVYWPQTLFPLHDLFERFPQDTTFEGSADEVFIRVPLGGAYGEIDHYLVGARIADGWVTAVGYLIPGEYAETPPAGMSGYEWRDGYWQAWQTVEE